MKKLYYILGVILFLLSDVILAQVSKSIDVTNSGTLSTLVSQVERNTVTHFTITGNIDASDVKFIRDEMIKLKELDISNVKINSYSGVNGTYSSTYYPENEMPEYSFYYGNGNARKDITKISLPNTITSIGAYAFRACTGITGSLVIPDSVIKIEREAFAGVNITSLTIGNSVTKIGDQSFQYCSRLTTLILGKSVNQIGYQSFYFVRLNLIYSLSDNPPIINTLWSFYTNPVVVFVSESAISAYKAAPKWNTFNLMTEKEVTIHNSQAGSLAANLISSGYGPLSSISHLTVTGKVNDVDITHIKSNMSILTHLDISECSIFNQKLLDFAFQNKTTLRNIKLPSVIYEIGKYAFSGCVSLDCEIPISSSLNYIGEGAFQGCQMLTGSLIIPDNITMIYSSTFNDCISLNGNISIPNSVMQIGNSTFSGCLGLTGFLNLPENLQSIGDNAFMNCSGLSGNLLIPSSITSIGEGAFSGCSGFTGNLSIPSNVTRINNSTFSNCSGITGHLIIPNTIISIGTSAFSGCSSITGLSLPYSVKEIPQNAFKDCISLTGNLIIPNVISRIGNSAFSGCSNLSELNLAVKANEIEDNAFFNCSGLTKISVPLKVPPTIYNNTFGGVNKENCILIVPTGSILTYQTSNYWDSFIFINEMDFEDIENMFSVKLEINYGGNAYCCNSMDKLPNGSIIYVEKENSILFYFEPSHNYELVSVIYDDVEVMSEIIENYFFIFQTPSVIKNTVIKVTFQNKDINTKNSEIIYNRDIRVYLNKNEIFIEGLNKGEVVNLFTINGMHMNTITSNSSIVKIPVNKNNLYFIKVREKIYKLIL